MGKPYVLSPVECDLLDAGHDNLNIPLGYFFSDQPGEKVGWQLDNNFEEEHAWQLEAAHAKQPRIVILGGFASGKTWWFAIAAAMIAAMYQDFKFLNIAPTYKQSVVAYEAIVTLANGCPFEKLIWKKRERPSPSITLRFVYRGKTITSTLEFWTGYDPKGLRTKEVDWFNIDQAESFEDLDDVLVEVGTRVRGKTGDRVRMGRLSMTANSDDNPTLWQQVDYGELFPDDYFVRIVSTRHNKNVTEEQLRMMIRDINEQEVAQKIDGARPFGKGLEFSSDVIAACEDEIWGEAISDLAAQQVPGYTVSRQSSAGVVYMETPRVDGRDYLLIGDPGKGTAPFRNAPVLFVWDVTEFPARLVAFWWGNGQGKIDPFIRMLFKFAIQYRVFYIGVDSTGTQAGTVEVINTLVLSPQMELAKIASNWQDLAREISEIKEKLPPATLRINGLDFSGHKKTIYLLATQAVLGAGILRWPAFFSGLKIQLLNYDKERDRLFKGKLVQDLVATLCMSSYVIGQIFAGRNADEDTENPDNEDDENFVRDRREVSGVREQRSPR